MDKLRIENFGPIISAELELRKYNIIIGPQGSGKSCILKIASFCKWLEKVYISGELDKYYSTENDHQFIEKYMLDFYKLKEFAYVSGYMYSKVYYNFNDNLEINIDFNINSKKWLTITEIRKNTTPKRVAYIPAERFIASTFSNLLELKMNQDTCIYKYLIDWENAHKTYKENKKFEILNLKTSFYYDEKTKTDYIYIPSDRDAVSKKIKFENASSGYQSIIPMCVLIEYYLNKEQYITATEKQKINELSGLGEIGLLNNREKSSKELLDIVSKYITINKDKVLLLDEPEVYLNPMAQKELMNWMIKNVVNETKEVSKLSTSSIFLEEPEANIFPETQYELMKWIVKTMSNGKDNSIFIATHSPYILSSFNNLILAGETISNNNETLENVETLTQAKHFVNFDEISVYEVNDRRVKPIKDDELRIIDTNSIDSVSNEINEQFSKMLDL